MMLALLTLINSKEGQEPHLFASTLELRQKRTSLTSDTFPNTFLILLYKWNWNYWRVEYLAICLNNVIGGIVNWQISVLYGEKPMLVV